MDGNKKLVGIHTNHLCRQLWHILNVILNYVSVLAVSAKTSRFQKEFKAFKFLQNISWEWPGLSRWMAERIFVSTITWNLIWICEMGKMDIKVWLIVKLLLLRKLL